MLIKSLSLKDFKCFEQVDIDFGKITLLTGANSSGKSSLIYALLGIMQSKYFPQYFALNGELINMGGFDDVLRKKAGKREFEVNITLQDYNHPYYYKTKWSEDITSQQIHLIGLDSKTLKFSNTSNGFEIDFKTSSKSNMDEYKRYNPEVKIIDESEKNGNNKHHLKGRIEGSIENMIEFIKSKSYYPTITIVPLSCFNYIGSFRLPPERTYYQKPKAGKIGVNGEGYIDQIIEWEGSDKKKYDKLIKAVTEMGLFKTIQASKMKGGRFELNVRVNENSELASLTDVGFGISQFLPIIVADLQMDFEAVLTISQPEIHLHPKIQAALADYLCEQISFNERQYIIETHSEYLINRMRLLIVKGELQPEDVALYFMENDGIKTTTHKIELTKDGQIKNAPQGFFDTYEMDVMDIALYASAQ